ncbi:MAG: hypothetical protein LBL45_04530 [Treponema sp.]|nr:hypothetical protein [Treponema sp.]
MSMICTRFLNAVAKPILPDVKKNPVISRSAATGSWNCPAALPLPIYT